jgi:hypothetical protein
MMATAIATGSCRLETPADFVVIRLLDHAVLNALRAEAVSQARFAGASFNDVSAPDGEGVPILWLDTAPGGPALAAFLSAPATLTALELATGRRWIHRGGAGSYAYYRQPFHFSGLHRDVGSCELSVITCIHDEPGEGGDLVLFPTRTREPLDAIRDDPDRGALRLRLQPGETLVMYGTVVPHCVTPVGPGRTRITAPACYRSV